MRSKRPERLPREWGDKALPDHTETIRILNGLLAWAEAEGYSARNVPIWAEVWRYRNRLTTEPLRQKRDAKAEAEGDE
jgi:hypothetical protein